MVEGRTMVIHINISSVECEREHVIFVSELENELQTKIILTMAWCRLGCKGLLSKQEAITTRVEMIERKENNVLVLISIKVL